MAHRGIQLTPMGMGRDVEDMAAVYPDPERQEWIRRRMNEWWRRRNERLYQARRPEQEAETR